jgi:hypothetical protein
MGVMMGLRRRTKAIATHAISVGKTVGQVTLGQPVERAIQTYPVDLGQTFVQLRMAERPAVVKKRCQDIDPRTGLSATGPGDQLARERDDRRGRHADYAAECRLHVEYGSQVVSPQLQPGCN